MVTWRSLRPVFMSLLLILTVLMVGSITVFDASPLRYLANLQQRFAQPEATPTSTPSPVPNDELLETSVIPYYPPVVITVPIDPLFAAESSTSPQPVRSHLAASLAVGGSCLMNDGSYESILPDCVAGEATGLTTGQ